MRPFALKTEQKTPEKIRAFNKNRAGNINMPFIKRKNKKSPPLKKGRAGAQGPIKPAQQG